MPNKIMERNDSNHENHKDGNDNVKVPETTHQISSDSWFQVAFVLTTGINSAYVLGYSGTIMVPLGWVGGVVGLILATVISLYANALVAMLHEYGRTRHIRYRDLAGFTYGNKYSSSTNATYLLFWDDHTMKLPYFIAIAGFVCALFATGIATLSALGVWLGIQLSSLAYIVISFVLSLKDGLNAPPRDFSIPGDGAGKIFSIIGASANLVFAYNTDMLPEIQATIKQPVVKNMMKALYFQFTVGVLPLYLVTFTSYWAYGNSTSAYLLNNVNGPIFASPMYEYVNTKYGITGSALKIKNLSFRFLLRGGYLTFNTFVSALLPFLRDFMSLTGAISTFPLTFVLANHMYLTAKKDKQSFMQQLWHWLNIVSLASCLL
ncbi:hypothetical protein AHAS_Ahas20G0148200 [Arachis hypogaea]